MSDVTQALREEHQRLLPEFEKLLVVADGIGELSRDPPRRSVDEAYDFLAHRLIPHAAAEEEVLYPVVAEALGTAQATTTMSRDHAEISRRAEQLKALESRIFEPGFELVSAKELRRALYGLYSILKLHLAKEEEFDHPILDSYLNEAGVHEICHRITELTRNEEYRLHH